MKGDSPSSISFRTTSSAPGDAIAAPTVAPLTRQRSVIQRLRPRHHNRRAESNPATEMACR
eukprot:227253-Pyramimonas_sp.AAC.1